MVATPPRRRDGLATPPRPRRGRSAGRGLGPASAEYPRGSPGAAASAVARIVRPEAAAPPRGAGASAPTRRDGSRRRRGPETRRGRGRGTAAAWRLGGDVVATPPRRRDGLATPPRPRRGRSPVSAAATERHRTRRRPQGGGHEPRGPQGHAQDRRQVRREQRQRLLQRRRRLPHRAAPARTPKTRLRDVFSERIAATPRGATWIYSEGDRTRGAGEDRRPPRGRARWVVWAHGLRGAARGDAAAATWIVRGDGSRGAAGRTVRGPQVTLGHMMPDVPDIEVGHVGHILAAQQHPKFSGDDLMILAARPSGKACSLLCASRGRHQ